MNLPPPAHPSPCPVALAPSPPLPAPRYPARTLPLNLPQKKKNSLILDFLSSCQCPQLYPPPQKKKKKKKKTSTHTHTYTAQNPGFGLSKFTFSRD